MHVVVTGASSGIGEAIAREYFSRNARVTLVARRRELLEKLASEGEKVHLVTADLSDPAQVTSWVDAAESIQGPIDVLINNAGVQIVRPFIETPFEEGRGSSRSICSRRCSSRTSWSSAWPRAARGRWSTCRRWPPSHRRRA